MNEEELLAGLSAAAFLDLYGRFAKSDETVAMVRLFYYGDGSPSLANETYADITIVEYKALTSATRQTIKDAGSGAGLIETEGKSNA